MLEPIVVNLRVNAPPARAFSLFVSRIEAWWPMRPFSMATGLLMMEPGLGGRIIETAADGEEFVWGHVTAWTEPDHLQIAWYVGRTVETATQIDVAFAAGPGNTTDIALTQSGWEALGDAAAEMRDRNDAGWRTILGDHFAPFVDSQQQENDHV